jgi:hypothetical protein
MGIGKNLFSLWTLVLLVAILLLTWLFDTKFSWTWFPEVIVAWGTIILALATFNLAKTTVSENKTLRDDNEQLRKDERRREFLNSIMNWAVESRQYADRIRHLNTGEERTTASDRYLYLKYNGKRLTTMLKSLKIDDDLESKMDGIVTLFEGSTYDRLKDNPEIIEELSKKADEVMEKTITLLVK